MSDEKKVYAGKHDGSVGPLLFHTLPEAEAWIETQEKIDPSGVYRGDYYIDAPEEMVNARIKESEKYQLTPLGHLLAAGNAMARELRAIPEFAGRAQEWDAKFLKYIAWTQEQGR